MINSQIIHFVNYNDCTFFHEPIIFVLVHRFLWTLGIRLNQKYLWFRQKKEKLSNFHSIHEKKYFGFIMRLFYSHRDFFSLIEDLRCRRDVSILKVKCCSCALPKNGWSFGIENLNQENKFGLASYLERKLIHCLLIPWNSLHSEILTQTKASDEDSNEGKYFISGNINTTNGLNLGNLKWFMP